MAQWVMPKKTAEIAGVSVQTLRAWEKAGTIPCRRTSGNTRQYDVSAYTEKTEVKRTILCYCRVSSTKKKKIYNGRLNI